MRAGQVIGEAVALKLVREVTPQAAQRFVQEAEALSELRHPGIVRYLGSGTTEVGGHYLAMEWLDGESLAQRLARGPLGLAQALALIARVGEALATAHGRGMVHRDIKPSNLWLRDRDPSRPALLDFGVVRLPAGQQQMTTTGTIVGTACYMAPEQARGDRFVGPRADVFSLGCVLFECQVGRPPFTGDSAQEVLVKIALEDPPALVELVPGTPLVVDELVARMLAKVARDRPSDGAMVAALAEAAASIPPGSAPVPALHLTGDERRLFAVILSGAADRGDQTIDRQTRPAGARSPLDGSLIIRLEATGTAGDLALRSAREALAQRGRAQGRPIALAIGHDRTRDRQAAPMEGARALAAEVEMWRGGYERGAQLAAQAMADARPGTPPWYEAAGAAATCLGRLARFDELVAMADKLAGPPDPGALPGFAAALTQAVTQLVHGGCTGPAAALRRLAAEVLAPIEEQEPFVRAHRHLIEAMPAVGSGDSGTALVNFERAVDEFDAAGNRRRPLMTGQNAAYCRAEIGDYEAAERGFRRVIAVAQKMGNLHVLHTAGQNLALALAKSGRDLDQAAALAAQSAAAFHDFPDPRHEASALGYLALAHLGGGQLDDAEESAHRGIAVARNIPPMRGALLAVLAQVLLRRGRAAEALAAAREGMALLDALGRIDEHVALLRLVHAEALAATGDADGARAAIADAWARLEASAARLEPALRRCYLEQVPENARTRELACGALEL